MSVINRCGTCHFGKIIVQDISKRMCHGAPPSVQLVPGPSGQVTMRMSRPVVSVSDEACALYRDKDVHDLVRDDDTVKMIQALPETATPQ